MHFIGVDISMFKHDCVVIDEIRDTILPSRSFDNDCNGFFERICATWNMKIGLVDTGRYG